jgi:hypothetical protein
MAQMSLSLQVFVASSSDVSPERRIVSEELQTLSKNAADHRLLVRPFLWELSVPAYGGDPQLPLSEELEKSELAIAIIWSRIGVGTEQELKLAFELFERRLIDDVGIYVKVAPPPQNATADGAQQVQVWHDRIKSQQLALTRSFDSDDEFRELVRMQLRRWLERNWLGVPEACEFALKQSGPIGMGHRSAERRWRQVCDRFDFSEHESLCHALGRVACDRYQQYGPAAASIVLPEDLVGAEAVKSLVGDEAPVPLELQRLSEDFGSPILSAKPLRRNAEGAVSFATLEWFYFFCSWGLIDAISSGNLRAVVSKPFVNPIHQYLKANVAARQVRLCDQLVKWLLNKDGTTGLQPVARNFAAYVLGMIDAQEAAGALAEALQRDPDPDVRLYCITSLGKLRARRYRPMLLERFKVEPEHHVRLTISQALCRIVGLVDFEL